METKNVYEDIVYLTFNIFKNEKTRTMIKLDETFEEKVLILMNDILLLEKDFEATFEDKTWFTEYAKTLVNIEQKKLKFEKVDNKKVEETYKDYSDLIVYITKNFDIKRSEFVTKDHHPNFDDLKFYQVVTSEMLGRYEKKEEPKVDVISDGPKVKADTSTGAGAGAGATGSANSNFNGGGAAGPNPFMGAMPQNPMMNDRFYPYKTKPKYVRPLRLFLGVTLIIFAVATLILFIFSTLPSATVKLMDLINQAGIKEGNLVDNLNKNAKIILGTSAGPTGMQFYMNLAFTIIYSAAVCWAGYRLMRPARTFRETFTTPMMTYILILIILIFVFAESAWQYIYTYNFLGFNQNKYMEDIIKMFTDPNTDYGKIFQDWTTTDADGNKTIVMSADAARALFSDPANIAALKKILIKPLTENNFMGKMTGFSSMLGIVIALFGISTITLIVSWVLNPRIDREKFAKLQVEMQMQMQYAMQGQRYDIDPSLFTPENEYEAVMKNIREREAKRKNRKSNLD